MESQASAARDRALFLTVPETATLLRTTAKAVYVMVGRGQLAGVVRIGRRILVDRAALLAALGGTSPEAAR